MNTTIPTRFTVILACLLSAPALGQTPTGGRPILHIDEKDHNLGVNWTGMQLRHRFVVRNDGDAELVISRIDFAPGCYQAAECPDKIAPKSSAEFPLAVDTREISGAFTKTATLVTNDPQAASVTLTLRGECKAAIELQPAFVGFGKILGDGAQQRSINITNKTDESFEVTLPVKEDSHYKYELIETTPGEEYKLFATTLTPMAQGRIESIVTLKTTLEAQPSLPIRVFAYCPPRLEVIPPIIALDGEKLRNSPRGLTRVVLYSNNGDKPVHLKKAVVDDPAVEVSMSEILAGKSYRIVTQFPQNYELPPQGSTLSLLTDDPVFQMVSVPIRMALPPGQSAPPKPIDPIADTTTVNQFIGKQAPAFNLTSIEGVGISNADTAKSVMLLNFFAPGEYNNFEQLKRLELLRLVYGPKGVRFINICQRSPFTDVPQERQMNIMSEAGLKSELVFDLGNTTGQAFFLTAYPTLVAVSKSGIIEGVVEGNVSDFEARVKRMLDTLLTGRSIARPAAGPTQPNRPALTMIGQASPDFSLSLQGGGKLTRADAAGHPATVLNFVAPNCGFCRRQIPLVETARAAYESKGVLFVNVGQTMRKEFSAEDVQKVMQELGTNLPLAHDPTNQVGRLFKVTSYPTLVILRPDGQIDDVIIGAKKNLGELLQARLDPLVSTPRK